MFEQLTMTFMNATVCAGSVFAIFVMLFFIFQMVIMTIKDLRR